MEIGDHVTILRDGRVCGWGRRKGYPAPAGLSPTWWGENKTYPDSPEAGSEEEQPVALKVEHLRLPKKGGSWLLDDVSFSEGEKRVKSSASMVCWAPAAAS